MVEIIEDRLSQNQYEHFVLSFQELKEATDLTRAQKASKLISQIDMLSGSEEGTKFLYDQVLALEEAGIFHGTPWDQPEKLIPSLVAGTLKSGHPNSSFEVLSELRMLAYANTKAKTNKITPQEAKSFIEEVLVHNLAFVFQEPTEEIRNSLNTHELKKLYNLFALLLAHSDLNGIKDKLAEEITLICEQRPIVTRRAREIIFLVKNKVTLDNAKASDQVLKKYVDAVFAPSKNAGNNQDIAEYNDFLKKASEKQLIAEAQELGKTMRSTGLVSMYHALLITHFLNHQKDDLLPLALDLNSTGKAEWHQYKKHLKKLITQILHPYHNQFLYGLAKMMEKGLFSRQAVRAGLENIRTIRIHPKVEERILKSIVYPQPDITALQYLIGALIRLLGQPLGVGQGNNPTCQSARGMSMWSQHAPAKLINMVITAATHDNLTMRFEGKELESNLLQKGLMEQLDYNLDAVSVVLVPKLDKIYNEMMNMASARGDDPHKWVNPSLYGNWIPVGFASVYDYMLNAIHDYQGFIRIFYAAFHPDFNGNRQLVYPVPIGIYITSTKGDMIGFHAVSLLRVKKDKNGVTRCYFLNPNNEGRQDWGQDIKPSVFGHGEQRGESSLPFDQFAARVYAFHYNQLEISNNTTKIPVEIIQNVDQLARNSWGKSYVWIDTKKAW